MAHDRTVEIIAPVYNGPKAIQTTLESLLNQTHASYQITVVDNASTDRTPDIVRSYDDRISLAHETDIQSSYAARNTGIRHTDSEILAFVDADMTVPEDWLEPALETFQTHDADYMGCNVELTLPDDPTIAARFDHHTGFPIQQYIEHQQFAPTCCLFVRRYVLEESACSITDSSPAATRSSAIGSTKPATTGTSPKTSRCLT